MEEKRRKHTQPTPTPRDSRHEPLPTWQNTRPRENQEPHRDDLARSRERWETVLGR